jgi:asparagine synthase (glutamine-hydrolysing)
MYLSLQTVKKNGFSSVITGDGADELFAGYNFWLKMNDNEIQNDLKRIRKIMHFPTQKIGKKLGIKVESPFLSKKVMDFAKSLPLDYKINKQKGEKYGKWILRKTFEKKIPNSIVWRKKSAMQDGAGTSGLINLFNAMLPNKFFDEQAKRIKESENVIIKSKESLYYYMIYRKYFDIPSNLHSSKSKCPNCQYKIELGSKFCRMCGTFPI